MSRDHNRPSEAEPASAPGTNTRDDPGSALCFLGLGANLGDRADNLRRAVKELSRLDGVTLLETSPVYETEAHTAKAHDAPAPDYLNAVLRIRTTLSPAELMTSCLDIERQVGRTRTDHDKWGSRTLDIDILMYGNLSLRREGLNIPHPRMRNRRFVLQPLFDIAPDTHVPDPFDVSVRYLLRQCPDRSEISRTQLTLSNQI